MHIDIPYGKEKIKINISEQYEILRPNDVKINDENATIEKALKNPINKESFQEFVDG